MGMLRDVAKGVAGFFFVTSFLAMLLIFGLEQFTQYSNLKPLAMDILLLQAKGRINETRLLQELASYCKIQKSFKFEFEGGEIEISCSEVVDKGAQEAMKIIASKVFDAIYHREYGCEFIDCLRNFTKAENLIVVVGQKANSFYKSAFKYATALTAFFLLAFLAACESWYSRAKDIGIALVFTGLPYLGFEFLANKFLQTFLPKEAEAAIPAIHKFLELLSAPFFLALISGIAALSIALAIRLRGRK